jgi:hypothetical protein
MQALAAAVIVDAIESLDLRWPIVSDADAARNALARQALSKEM